MEEYFFMFGLVITTEAHLAYAGSTIHSNNTADLSSVVEVLSFSGGEKGGLGEGSGGEGERVWGSGRKAPTNVGT